MELGRASLPVGPCVAEEEVTAVRVDASLFRRLLGVGLNGPPLRRGVRNRLARACATRASTARRAAVARPTVGRPAAVRRVGRAARPSPARWTVRSPVCRAVAFTRSCALRHTRRLAETSHTSWSLRHVSRSMRRVGEPGGSSAAWFPTGLTPEMLVGGSSHPCFWEIALIGASFHAFADSNDAGRDRRSPGGDGCEPRVRCVSLTPSSLIAASCLTRDSESRSSTGSVSSCPGLR